MAYQIILWWATVFLRLYFRKTIVYGSEHIPRNGPLIVASNHPSAFLEASVLATVMGRPIHFLVRGDMFNPRFSFLFKWTKQIPIYRQKDGISNLRKNASSFDLTYRKLAEGNAVLIFPEAKTILEKSLRPVQRGTAHLAFGTLPFMKGEDKLAVLPVGVNFTEPRTPGTDVVIRFGAPFMTENASREDREAIERFTDTLTHAMNPLVIQIHDHGYEHHYEVLASIYYQWLAGLIGKEKTHEHLVKISEAVNRHESNQNFLEHIHAYIKKLKHYGIAEAIYFPKIIVMNHFSLSFVFLLKILWFLAGGWIWRLARHVIFSKIKAVTFHGPTSVGVAMLLIPLVAFLFLLVCLIAGWPVWYVLVWLFVMWLGKFLRPPLKLMFKIIKLSPKVKTGLKGDLLQFKKELQSLLST